MMPMRRALLSVMAEHMGGPPVKKAAEVPARKQPAPDDETVKLIAAGGSRLVRNVRR